MRSTARVVWKALVAQGKAFDISALDAKALLHNLNDGDYAASARRGARPLLECAPDAASAWW